MGLYKGVLKPKPVDLTGKSASWKKKHRCFEEVEMDKLKGCCAVDVIAWLPEKFGGTVYRGGGGFGLGIYEDIDKETDMSLFIDHMDKFIRASERGYIIVTINDEQEAAGVGDVLVDYFGFSLLDDPFTNPKHENRTRVSIYGLCKSKYVPFE